VGDLDGVSSWTPAPLEPLGDRPWVVFGGGGLKGLAHAGAWQAIQEAGLPVAGIVGTSIGALVGACLAGGMGWRDLAPLAFAIRRGDIARINRRALLFNGIRQEALLQSEPLREFIRVILPVREWDELTLPLQINAVDLDTGDTVWFGPGADTSISLEDALYASAALPVFYPPLTVGGRTFVDGGVEFTLGLGRAVDRGATGLIGIDVGSGQRGHADRVRDQGLIAIHQRVFSIMSWRKRHDLVRHWTEPPLLMVRPRLDGFGTFDFDETQYFLEEGYRAARAALRRGVGAAEG
jgi:NTE family protein